MELIINMILFNTINRLLILFNYLITANTIYYFDIHKLKGFKDYFIITLDKVNKTKDKKLLKIIKSKTLFKYNYGKR